MYLLCSEKEKEINNFVSYIKVLHRIITITLQYFIPDVIC